MGALHPQAEKLLARDVRLLADGGGLEALRVGYAETADRLGGEREDVARVEDLVIPRPDGPALAARGYVPVEQAGDPGAIVWFHGGGWVIGDLPGFDRVARSLANASGHVVITVDYRLAPEHTFPAAVDDAEAAVRWAAGEVSERLGFDPARRMVGGDSAGGLLAASAAHRRPGRLRGQLLVYPALDPLMVSRSYEEFREGPFLTAAEMESCWTVFLGGADGFRASALQWGDYAHLPPAWIALAGVDPLRDDGAAYANLLERFGVEIAVERYEDMPHGFLRWGGVIDRQRELIAWLGDAARTALA